MDKDLLIQEFIARKEQILNLEMRLFILVFAIEIVFVLFYLILHEKLRSNKTILLIALSVYLVFFFEMVAINGKMGLISMYLRQMESYFASIGYQGLIWESRALDSIIFVPGNAFTLPAFLTISFLLSQTVYALQFTFSSIYKSKSKARFFIILISAIVISIVVKSLTVDFYRELPNVFK